MANGLLTRLGVIKSPAERQFDMQLQAQKDENARKFAVSQLANPNLPERLREVFRQRLRDLGYPAMAQAQPIPAPQGEIILPGEEFEPGRRAPASVGFAVQPTGAVTPFRTGPTTQQTVNVGGQQFGAELVEKELGNVMQRGAASAPMRQAFEGMRQILESPDFETGALARPITALQALAADAGVNLQGVANSLGINLGKLEDKEEFNRLSKRLLLDKFRGTSLGNLNRQEVQIFKESVADLGLSEEANIMAVSAGLAAARLNQQRAQDAITSATTQTEARALLNEISGDDASEFLRTRDEIAERIRSQRQRRPSAAPAAMPLSQLPQGAVLEKRIGKRMIFRTPDGRLFVLEP